MKTIAKKIKFFTTQVHNDSMATSKDTKKINGQALQTHANFKL
jgi:hypothetical protein